MVSSTRTDLVRLIKEQCPSVKFVSGGFIFREKEKRRYESNSEDGKERIVE